MALSSDVLNFSLTVLVRIVASLIMQTDYLDFVCCPGEKNAPKNYVLPNVVIDRLTIFEYKKSLNQVQKLVQSYVKTEKW